MKTPKLDPYKLTPEQRDKIDSWSQNKQIIQNLEDMIAIIQDFTTELSKESKNNGKTSKEAGALLLDMRESLNVLRDKQAPEMPDYAKPVVTAVGKLETALMAAIKAIDTKPQVNVEAPNVTTKVDLSGVEKILKTDIPKAFKESIALIPEVEIPESDYTPLIQIMEHISRQLEEIDTGVRMKPQAPSTIKVTNVDGSPIGSIPTLVPGTDWDLLTATSTGASTEDIALSLGGNPVVTFSFTYTGPTVAKVSDDISTIGAS